MKDLRPITRVLIDVAGQQRIDVLYVDHSLNVADDASGVGVAWSNVAFAPVDSVLVIEKSLNVLAEIWIGSRGRLLGSFGRN